MIRWNKATALATGLIMIVLGNAVALTGAYYNRSGEPDAKVTLTQRELHISYLGGFLREHSGIAFSLNWRVSNNNLYYTSHWVYPDWLNETKLKDIGFDTSLPTTTRHADRDYRKMLPREAYVVLEYEGPAYEARIEQLRNNLEQQQQLALEHPNDKQHVTNVRQAELALKNEEKTFSHLYAVDAGSDKNMLRQRYPNRNRYIIVTGQVRIALSTKGDKSPPHLTGRIQALNIKSITAPYSVRQRIKHFFAKKRYSARRNFQYNITLAYGKRLEPWIADFSIIQPDRE